MGIHRTIAAAAALLATAATAVAAATADAPWSYAKGPTGPAHWGELQPASEYAGCAVGVPHQSPINVPARSLRSASGRSSLGDATTLHRTRLTLEPSTHSVHFECPEPKDGDAPCGVTHWEGRRFHLANVHFHQTSEHTWGAHAVRPLAEMHMEHGAADGGPGLVVAVPLHDRSLRALSGEDHKSHTDCDSDSDSDGGSDSGSDSDSDDDHEGVSLYGLTDAVATLVRTGHRKGGHAGDRKERGHNDVLERFVLASEEGHGASVRMASKHWKAIVDAHAGYCSYAGSTTTPSCKADITWLVSTTPTHISAKQAARLLAANSPGSPTSARPVQPLQDRRVMCSLGRRPGKAGLLH